MPDVVDLSSDAVEVEVGVHINIAGATKKQKEFDSAVAKAAKKLVADKAKAKQAKKEASFRCEQSLIDLYLAKKLGAHLQACTTDALKCICETNGVPKSGAKYALVDRLSEHVETAFLSGKAKAKAAAGDKSGEYELAMNKFKSFEAAFNHAKKLIQKINRDIGVDGPLLEESISIMAGVAAGFDRQLLTAITGKNRKRYNGAGGDFGMTATEEVAKGLLLFVQGHVDCMSAETLERVIDNIGSHTLCEPYGFQTYWDIIGAQLEELKGDESESESESDDDETNAETK